MKNLSGFDDSRVQWKHVVMVVVTWCVGESEVDERQRDGLSRVDSDQPRTLRGTSPWLLCDDARQKTSLAADDHGSGTALIVSRLHCRTFQRRHNIADVMGEVLLCPTSDQLCIAAPWSFRFHCSVICSTIQHPVPDRVQPVICNFWHPGTLTLRAERQSTRMSKITNDWLNPVRHSML